MGGYDEPCLYQRAHHRHGTGLVTRSHSLANTLGLAALVITLSMGSCFENNSTPAPTGSAAPTGTPGPSLTRRMAMPRAEQAETAQLAPATSPLGPSYSIVWPMPLPDFGRIGTGLGDLESAYAAPR